MNLEVANRLQQLRKAKGLSQEELANILGLSRQAISKWERAETSPDTDNLICLARLYNISIDKLLDTSESTEEIKKRIAQERISEVTNKDEEEKVDEIEEEIIDSPENDSGKEILTDEEQELKKKREKLNGRVMFSLVGIGILAYIIIAKTYNDWSIGWEFIPIGLFSWGLFNGFFEDRQFSILSFFFILFFFAIAFRDIYWSTEVATITYTVLFYIIFITLIIYSFVAIIMLLIHIGKCRKESEIIYFKEKINKINEEHYKEVQKLTKK